MSYIKVWKYGNLTGINFTNLFSLEIPQDIKYQLEGSGQHIWTLPIQNNIPDSEIGFPIISSDRSLIGEVMINSFEIRIYLRNLNSIQKPDVLSISGSIIFHNLLIN